MEKPGQDTLISFFRGTCPPEEERAVKIYLAMNVDKEYVEACMQEAFPDLADEHDPNIGKPELDRVWNKIQNKKQASQLPQLKLRNWWNAYAAAIAFVLLSTAIVFTLKNKWESSLAQMAWKQIRAGAGRPRTVQLADGSSVILFPGSGIQVPQSFNQSDRQVKLTGRAFFKIVHNVAKPFYVRTAQLVTKDLGTSFEINTSAIATENAITLHTGRASVSYSGKEIALLKPDQRILFNKSTKQFKVIHINAAMTTRWLNGELGYDQVPLKTIFYDLAQWYGVHITAVNSIILNQKVTISFKDLPISTVLNMLSKSAEFGYTITGKQIKIYERPMDID